jgi:hypothetical protein
LVLRVLTLWYSEYPREPRCGLFHCSYTIEYRPHGVAEHTWEMVGADVLTKGLVTPLAQVGRS